LTALDELVRLRPEMQPFRCACACVEDDHHYDRAVADITQLQLVSPTAQYLLLRKCRDEAFGEKLMKTL